MNMVLQIVLAAVVVGLFVPKRYERHGYWVMALWIVFVLIKYYNEH